MMRGGIILQEFEPAQSWFILIEWLIEISSKSNDCHYLIKSFKLTWQVLTPKIHDCHVFDMA